MSKEKEVQTEEAFRMHIVGLLVGHFGHVPTKEYSLKLKLIAEQIIQFQKDYKVEINE